MRDPAVRRVAAVLDQVVTDFGRRSAEDPRRLRGLLTDALGVEAPDVQLAVDAIVAAAERGLPRRILSTEGAIDRVELVAGLTRSGIDPSVADDVVDAWMTALRVQDRSPTDPGDTAVPPPATLQMQAEPTILPPQDAPQPDAPPDPHSRPARTRFNALASDRRTLVILGVVVVVLGLSGVGFAAFGPDEPEASTSAAGETTTTLPTRETTTPSTAAAEDEPLTAFEFPTESPEWGATVDRSWEVDGADLAVEVVVSSGDEAASGSVWDVFPASLDIDSSTLDLTTTTEITDGDPDAPGADEVLRNLYVDDAGLRMLLALQPSTTVTLQYAVAIPEDVELEGFLEGLHDEWETAMEELLSVPPPKIDASAEVDGSEAVVTGTATKGATVRILGKDVKTTKNGSFEHRVPLEPGENLISGLAVHLVAGTRAEFELTVEYEPPVTTTTTRPPSRGPGGSPTTPTTAPPSGPGTTAPPTTAPPTTAPPTTAPPTTSPPTTSNSAPTRNCGSEYWVLSGYSSSYGIGMYPSCFSDAEGDSYSLFANQPNWGSIGSFGGTCSYGAGSCWTYYPYSGWDGTAYEASFTIYATDEHGATSSAISVTLCVNC